MQIALTKGANSAVLDTHGGELVSYKDAAGTEYIWQGNPAFWSGRNPVLFPIVGNLKDGKIRIDGAEFAMKNHGFARRMEFSILEQGASFAVLALDSSEETRAQYPFDFQLRVRHELTENGFRTSFEVENKSEGNMPFCIGAHTAFNCPLTAKERFEDYIIRFDDIENLPSRLCTTEGYIHGSETVTGLANTDRIYLKHETFDKLDTIVLEGLQTRAAELVNPATGHGVRMEFEDFPMFSLWSAPNKNAPYICLEPWHGCNHIPGEGAEFADKHDCIVLSSAEAKTLSYKVDILP